MSIVWLRSTTFIPLYFFFTLAAGFLFQNIFYKEILSYQLDKSYSIEQPQTENKPGGDVDIGKLGRVMHIF